MARLRPSSAPMRYHCAASLQMQEMFPELEESEEAREGTAVHWIASECLIEYASGAGVSLAWDYIGKIAPNGVVITDTMADGADVYINSVLNVCQSRGLLKHMQVEQWLQIPRIHPTESAGTPDNWIWDEAIKTLDVWDLKFGYSVIEAFENMQLIEYAVGILDRVTGGHALVFDDVSINFHIIQPRAYHPDGVDRVWSINSIDLRAIVNQLISQADLALKPNPPAKSGLHCRYCTAIAYCQTAQRAATNAIDHCQNMTVEIIPPDQLALHRDILKRSIKAIENRLTGVESEIETLIRGGATVDGLLLANPQGRLAWNKSDAEILALGELMQVNLSKTKPITPTQAKQFLPAELLEAFSHNPAGKTKLVDSTTTKAAKVFGAKKESNKL